MTTQPTKEALEPCPWCKAVPRALGHYFEVFHPPTCFFAEFSGALTRKCIYREQFERWNSYARITASIVAPEVDDEQVTPTMVIEALRMMVQLWDDNHSDDPCGCVGASDDCKFPPPCELCCAREALRSFAIERPRQVFDVGFATPASTVAPQQSGDGDTINRSDAIRILQDARFSGSYDLRGLIAEMKGLPNVSK